MVLACTRHSASPLHMQAPGGRLCVILPALQGEADEFAALAQIQGLVLVSGCGVESVLHNSI